jgi:ABC-2 type transport system ATP-binding protein
MSDIAVSIKDVKKTFLLPNQSYDSLKRKILEVFRKKQRGHTTYQALKGVNLDINKGEFIGILGRNGAGKSTLLKIIAQIYQPSQGKVDVNGRLVPFIELGVGFKSDLSGRDNVYLNAAMLGFSRPEIDEMYDSIVDFAELHEFMGQKLKNYSSGMKVRLAFSVAIKANADILLLDEVLAVGDAAFKRKCYAYFDTLKQNKKTIIFVTHNMSAVRDYCDRAVIVDNGIIAFDGSPDEAAEEYFQLFNATKKVKTKEKKLILSDVTVDSSEGMLGFKVEVKNETRKPIDDVIVRLVVKRQSGRAVAGFDNKNIDVPFEIDFKPGEQKVLYFESPNIIGNGDYLINASLHSGGRNSHADEEDSGGEELSTIIYDSRLNIAQFSVKKAASNVPIILPAILSKKR